MSKLEIKVTFKKPKERFMTTVILHYIAWLW